MQGTISSTVHSFLLTRRGEQEYTHGIRILYWLKSKLQVSFLKITWEFRAFYWKEFKVLSSFLGCWLFWNTWWLFKDQKAAVMQKTYNFFHTLPSLTTHTPTYSPRLPFAPICPHTTPHSDLLLVPLSFTFTVICQSRLDFTVDELIGNCPFELITQPPD